MAKYNSKSIEKVVANEPRSFYQKHSALTRAVVGVASLVALAFPVYAAGKTSSKAPKPTIRGTLTLESKAALNPTKKPDNQFYIDFKKDSTSNSVGDFLYGVTRPLQLYGTDPMTGERKILPFYLEPFKAGGFLGFMIPGNWRDHTSLTLGTLVSELGIAAIISNSGSSDNNTTPAPKPKPTGHGHGPL